MRKGMANVSMTGMAWLVPYRRGAGNVGTTGTTVVGGGLARFILFGVVCAGCSSGSYDREFAERLRAYGSSAEFAPLKTEATAAATGRFAIRLPKAFTDQIDDQKEATPPFLRDFPGFVAAYRGLFPVGTTQFPVMLVVGDVPAAERRRDDVKKAILEQVRADESFRKAAWGAARQVEDAAGQPRSWDVLTLDGEQPFELVDAGSPVEKRRPGVTEIWVSADPKQKSCVVLAWRVPAEVAAAVPLATLAPLAARTVTIAD